jgi:hypothetical protein
MLSDNNISKRWENFKNDKNEGIRLEYYQTGKIEYKDSLANDQLEGKEYAYYPDGRVWYVKNWRHDKLYGEYREYFKNGGLGTYSVYDALEKPFYIRKFDSKGIIKQEKGVVFSDHLYSVNTQNDSTVLLKNNGVYKDIETLYITTATPPNLHVGFEIEINNKSITALKKDGNTTIVHGVFAKTGVYRVKILGLFFEKNSDGAKGHEMDITITKK